MRHLQRERLWLIGDSKLGGGSHICRNCGETHFGSTEHFCKLVVKYRVAQIFRTSDKWVEIYESDIEKCFDVNENGRMRFTEFAKNKYRIDSYAIPFSVSKNNETIIKNNI